MSIHGSGASSTPTRIGGKRAVHGDLSVNCTWCQQRCEELIRGVGCTHECMLAVELKIATRYDIAYTELLHSHGGDVTRTPKPSRKRNIDETTQDYWIRNLQVLYPSKSDYRRHALRVRLLRNQCEVVAAVSAFLDNDSSPTERPSSLERDIFVSDSTNLTETEKKQRTEDTSNVALLRYAHTELFE